MRSSLYETKQYFSRYGRISYAIGDLLVINKEEKRHKNVDWEIQNSGMRSEALKVLSMKLLYNIHT